MNYYQPRELMDAEGKPTGLYHYTCRNDNRIWPVGYCSPREVCPDCQGHSGLLRPPDTPPCARCGDKGLVPRENPCPGHATPEEAREHYRQYLLDHARYDGRIATTQRKCLVCGAWTQGYASDHHSGIYDLCDEHRNREGLAQVMAPVGDIIASW